MKKFLTTIKELIYPDSCIFCLANITCRRCSHYWVTPAVSISLNKHWIYSALLYDSDIARIIVQAKEGGNRRAEEFVISALNRSLNKLFLTLDLNLPLFMPIALIPIPSSKKSNRRRGRDYLYNVTKDLCKQRKKNDRDCYLITSRKALHHNRVVTDQSLLNNWQRSKNMDGAISLLPKAGLEKFSAVILVDDVITTGATLKAAFSALEARQICVLGAITACASRRQIPNTIGE